MSLNVTISEKDEIQQLVNLLYERNNTVHVIYNENYKDMEEVDDAMEVVFNGDIQDINEPHKLMADILADTDLLAVLYSFEDDYVVITKFVAQ